MKTEITDGMLVKTAAFNIGIPLSDWTPQLSYLVCRALVDENMLPGKAVIGTLRERVYDSRHEGQQPGYAIVYSNYAWIDTGDGLIDPCKWGPSGADKSVLHTGHSLSYFSGIDPLAVTRNELPVHYTSDELYPIRRGYEKETLNRLLGFKEEVPGLTMVEAAYLAERPPDELGRNCRILYEFLIKNKLNKLIPLSHVQRIFPQMAKASPRSFRSPQAEI